jgi:hypothetical protein
MSVTSENRATLRDRAAAVLHGNDAGSWTKASPVLYPHQWSWDSAFIAIGWAHLDVGRAMTELEQLFAAQWATGMVPHLVFRAGPDHPYFPGPEWWDTPVSAAAPAPPMKTTGICQPPVHALALQRIWQLTPQARRPEIRARMHALYPRLVSWLDRGRAGLASRFDAQSGQCIDYDVRAGEDIRVRTFADFAPLFARTADAGQRAAQMRLLDSEDFCGHPRLRWRLLPSTSPAEPAFEPQNYWRGPVWPVINWLLWQSLSLLGYSARADEIRRDSLSQIAAAGDLNEYFEPFTGKPLGSPQQSWTAAVTLDWAASDHGGEAS